MSPVADPLVSYARRFSRLLAPTSGPGGRPPRQPRRASRVPSPQSRIPVPGAQIPGRSRCKAPCSNLVLLRTACDNVTTENSAVEPLRSIRPRAVTPRTFRRRPGPAAEPAAPSRRSRLSLKALVVGCGPSRPSAACCLPRLGHDVVIRAARSPGTGCTSAFRLPPATRDARCRVREPVSAASALERRTTSRCFTAGKDILTRRDDCHRTDGRHAPRASVALSGYGFICSWNHRTRLLRPLSTSLMPLGSKDQTRAQAYHGLDDVYFQRRRSMPETISAGAFRN
ncbi:hypothetical protein LuPra_00761 [Luteitalea pratensis]|uniref:Uncharacterized protein n=1 Tax=Luteitalea pratensis TaxID=1855912 RepID=A0A143PHM7_LUTPR|nr:hypothetical protein LuPra_00761 [Luteitalea pratensis]